MLPVPTVSNDVKAQVLITLTTVFLELSVIQSKPRTLEIFVEVLLDVISKVNKSNDRNLRAVAAECLSEIELANPLVLSEKLFQLANIAEQELTHSFESYMQLTLVTLKHLSISFGNGCKREELTAKTISNQKKKLLPFQVPSETQFHPILVPSLNNFKSQEKTPNQLPQNCVKEIMRILSLIVQDSFYFTKYGQLELIVELLFFEEKFDFPKQMFKHNFSRLLYVNSPLLFHALLYIRKYSPSMFQNIEDELLCGLLMSFVNDEKL